MLAATGAVLAAGAGVLRRPKSASGSAELEFGTGRAFSKPVRLNPPEPFARWERSTIGTSVLGVPIERWDIRRTNPARHVVVVCGVHGDERAGEEIADRCSRIAVPDDMHYTIVPMLNPDGWVTGDRNNANDVDINRNFPWGWNQFTAFSGPTEASEPETQAAMQLLSRKRPSLVVWFHQPLDYVAALRNCPPEYAQLWADVAGVPLRPVVRQVGGGETWASEVLQIPSMLIEVGGLRDAPVGVADHVRALEALLPTVR